MIKKQKKENQRFRKKEFRKWVWKRRKETIKENIEESIKEGIHFGITYIGGFIIFSIVTGIFGFFVGLMYNNNGVFGFLIGFLAPLFILFVLFILYGMST